MRHLRRIIGLLVVLSAVGLLAVTGLGVAAVSAGDSAATEVDVSLDPANQTVDPGEAAAYDIVVEGVTDDIGAYMMTVELGNASVATVEAFEHAQEPTFDNTKLTNSSVEVSAGMGDNTIDGGAEVVLGTVTVVGDTNGETPVTFSGGVDDVGVSNGSGDQYDVASATGGTLAVDRPEVDVGLVPADQTVGVGDNVTYDVVVEGATEGISAYAMTIDVVDSSVAGIEGFEHAQEPMFDDTQVSDGSVEVNAAMGDNTIGASNETVLGTLAVSGESTGATGIAIDQDSVDVALDDESVSSYGVGAVTDGSLEVSQRTAGVELVAPESVTAGNVTLEVVVTGADSGISAYDMSLSSGNQSVTFVDYELTAEGGSVPFDNSAIADDGSALSLVAALGEVTYGPGEEIQVATVTVNVDATGTFALGFEEPAIQDTDNNGYAVTGEELSLSVDPGPPTVPGGNGPPQNLGITPDTYEDIDGDGSLTIFDVQTLFTNLDSQVVNEHAAAFSFNNGDMTAVTIFDVQALFGLA